MTDRPERVLILGKRSLELVKKVDLRQIVTKCKRAGSNTRVLGNGQMASMQKDSCLKLVSLINVSLFSEGSA